VQKNGKMQNSKTVCDDTILRRRPCVLTRCMVPHMTVCKQVQI